MDYLSIINEKFDIFKDFFKHLTDYYYCREYDEEKKKKINSSLRILYDEVESFLPKYNEYYTTNRLFHCLLLFWQRDSKIDDTDNTKIRETISSLMEEVEEEYYE